MIMVCPKCGSENVTVVPITTTTTKGKSKGFGWCKGCLMTCIIGPFGWLCGLCGMGKGKTKTSHKTKMVNVCQNCGKRF